MEEFFGATVFFLISQHYPYWTVVSLQLETSQVKIAMIINFCLVLSTYTVTDIMPCSCAFCVCLSQYSLCKLICPIARIERLCFNVHVF